MRLINALSVAVILLVPPPAARAQTTVSSDNCNRSVAHMIPGFVGSWTMRFRAGYTLTDAGKHPIPTSNTTEVVRVDAVEDPPTLLFKAPASFGAPAGTVFKLEPFSGATWEWTIDNSSQDAPSQNILNSDKFADSLGCDITNLPRLYGTYETEIPGWSDPLKLDFRMIMLAEDEFRTVDENGTPVTVNIIESMVGIFDITSEHGGGQRIVDFRRE